MLKTLAEFRVLALCCASQERAVSVAAGVAPYTSPPAHYETFKLGNHIRTRGPFDLLYLSLHGYETLPYLHGDRGIPAVAVADFQELDLSQTVVFAASCHFTQTPFVPAILACKPRLLIGGPGRNYTRPHTLVGANLLGYLLRIALQLNTGGVHPLPPPIALSIAKAGLHVRTSLLKQRLKKLSNSPRHCRTPDSAGDCSEAADCCDDTDDRREQTRLRLAEDIHANIDALTFHTIQRKETHAPT
jgi:hypothetical protein